MKNVKIPRKLTEYSQEELIALVQSLEQDKSFLAEKNIALEQQLKLYEEWIRLNREKSMALLVRNICQDNYYFQSSMK